MEINIREFIRNFKYVREAVQSGVVARVVSSKWVFIFKLEEPRAQGLLGCCELQAPPTQKDTEFELGPVEDSDSWEENNS